MTTPDNRPVPRFSSGREPEIPEEYKRWRRTGSGEDLEALFNRLEPIIKSAVGRYAGGDESYYPRARILARRGLDNYNPDKGASLTTHIYNTLGRLRRIKGEREAVMYTPERHRMGLSKMENYTSRYKEQHGREPSTAEIMEELGISSGMVEKLRKASRGTISMEQMESEKGDPSVLPGKSDFQDVWEDYVYYDSDPVDRRIMEGLTGYSGAEQKSREALSEELGLDRSTVGRRAKKIEEKLSERPADL